MKKLNEKNFLKKFIRVTFFDRVKFFMSEWFKSFHPKGRDILKSKNDLRLYYVNRGEVWVD